MRPLKRSLGKRTAGAALLCLVLLLSVGPAWATDWFGPADETVIPSGSFKITVGTLTGDAYPDVAIGYEDVVRIYASDGLGGFTPGLELPSPDAAWNVAVGDFDGDGNDDIASTDYSSGPQRIHYGDGEGGFPRAESFETVINNGVPFLRAFDLDEDGFDDLVIPSNPDVLVCWGSTDGMIVDAALLDYSLNAFCTSIVRDVVVSRTTTGGLNDIVVLFDDNDYSCGGNQANRVIARFRNLGNRQFGPVEFLIVDPYTTGGHDWKAIVAGDIDGDSDLDFVVVGSDPAGVRSVLKTGPAQWQLGPESAQLSSVLAMAHLDDDPHPDIVLNSKVYRGLGDGTFEFGHQLNGSIRPPVPVDFDGDGDLDLVGKNTTTNRLYAFPNLTANPTAVGEPESFRNLGISILPSVISPGGTVEIRGATGALDVVDATGRRVGGVEGNTAAGTVTWSVPADLPSGRYWMRSIDATPSGSIVVVR